MKIHLKVTSAVLAVLLTASLLGLFTLPALGNDYHAGTFGITVTNAGHLHSMKLTLDMDTIVLYDQTQHLSLLHNLFIASSKTQVMIAERALANYLNPIAAWLAAADADAGTAFNAMCEDIEDEANDYFNSHNRSLVGYTPSYSIALRPSWERAAATATELANDERTYFDQSGSSPLETFDASYVKATTFEALSDLTKTTCLRAKITIRIIRSAGTSTFYAYSSEAQVGPQEYHAATAATCTEDGLEEYYICSTCGRKVSFYTNGALNQHTANGVASVHLMVMDDESLIVEEAPGHRWDEGVITTPATCSSEGETLYTCTVCGETDTQTVPMIPHTVAPDAGWIYEADGAYRYHVCTVCGAETDKEEPTALTFPYTQTCGQYKLHGTTVELDHNYPRFDVDEYVALHFDYKEETDPALKAEKLALRNAYKAFFVNWFAANGWESTINSVISYIEADTTTRALAEQNTAVTYNYNVQFHLNNGTYKQLYALEGSADQPDYTYANTVPAIDFSIRPQNGEYDFDLIDKFVVGLHVTTRYGATSSSVYVARRDMSFTTINKYPQAVAVCGATGYAQDVWYCAACGGYYSYYQADGTPYTVLCEDGVTRLQLTEIDVSEYLIDPPAASHNFAGAVTLEPTCTEDGIRTFTCLNCGYSYTLPIEALGHNLEHFTIEPTCTEPGANVYGCTRCDYVEESEAIPATGHDYAATVVAPTCTEGGYTLYVCGNCGDTYTDDETAPAGHAIDAAVWYYAASDPDLNKPVRYHVCAVCGEVCDKEVPTHHPIPWNGNSNYHDTKVTQPMNFPRFDTAEYVALYNAYLALPEGEEKDAAYAQAYGYRQFHRMFVCMSNAYWTLFDAMVNAIEADPANALVNGYGVTYYYDILKGSGASAVSINTLDGVTDHSFTNVEVFDFSIRPRVSDYPYNSSWNYRSVLYAQLYYGTAQAPLQVEYTGIGPLFLQTLNEVEPTCGADGCRPYFYCSNNSCRKYFSFYSDADTINYVTCEDGVVRQKMVDLGRSQSAVKELLKVPATGDHTMGEGWYYDPSAPERCHVCTVCGAHGEYEYIPVPTISVLRSDNCDPHYYNTTVSQPQDFPRFDTAEFVALYNAYLALPEGDEKQAALDQVNGYAKFHKYIIGGNVGNPAYDAFERLISAIKADPDNAVANGLGVTYFYDWKFGGSDVYISTYDGTNDHSFTNVPVFDFSIVPRVTPYDFSTNDYYRGGLFSTITYNAQNGVETFNSVPFEVFMFAPAAYEALEPTCTEAGHAAFWRCQNCSRCFSTYTDGTTLNTVVCDDGIERLKMTVVGTNVAAAEAALAIPAAGHTPGEDWVYNDEHTQRWHICTVCGEICDLEDVEEPSLFGDVNRDGSVTISDVTALLDVLSGQGEPVLAICDLNDDEQITIADVTALLDLLSGNAP